MIFVNSNDWIFGFFYNQTNKLYVYYEIFGMTLINIKIAFVSINRYLKKKKSLVGIMKSYEERSTQIVWPAETNLSEVQ